MTKPAAVRDRGAYRRGRRAGFRLPRDHAVHRARVGPRVGRAPLSGSPDRLRDSRGPSGRAVAPVRLSRVRRRPGGGQSGPGVPYTHFPRETPARAKGRNNVPQRSDGDACDDSAIKKRMLLLRRPRAEH